MDIIEAALRLVGAFYAFAGYAATRAGLTSLCVDQAIVAIGGKKPSRSETAQSVWLLAAAALIMAGGIALALLLDASVWLFLVSAVGQGFYLFALAPRLFDAAEPPSAAGRRQSHNAFAVYLVATAFVVWAASNDRLLAWHEVPAHWLAVGALAFAAHVAYVLWTVIGIDRMSRPSPSIARLFAEPPEADELPDRGQDDPSRSRSVKVKAGYQSHPLWALDDELYGDFPPERLGLSPALTRDLAAWAESFTASVSGDEAAGSLWTAEQRRDHDLAGKALAVRLARERPDLKIYVEDGARGVVEVTGHEHQ